MDINNTMEKPFSQACENNKQPILDVIGQYFADAKLIFEIGSGTAQHAVFFAEKLSHLYWQTSDQQMYIEGINLRLNDYSNYNLGRPIVLDVMNDDWPIKNNYDGVFTANTCHIMNQQMVEKMFVGVGKMLSPNKYFCIYGPFNFNGQYTAESNQSFDQMLRLRDPGSGLRNFEDLEKLAESQGLRFFKRHDLPANNNILIWKKIED